MNTARAAAGRWWRRRLRQAEAVLTLLVADAAIRCCSFERLIAIRRPVRPAAAGRDGMRSGMVGAVVRAAARALPHHPACLAQALAVRWMLQRRGVASTLHLGTAFGGAGGDRPMSAHAWVSVDGRSVVGGRERGRVTEVASFTS